MIKSYRYEKLKTFQLFFVHENHTKITVNELKVIHHHSTNLFDQVFAPFSLRLTFASPLHVLSGTYTFNICFIYFCFVIIKACSILYAISCISYDSNYFHSLIQQQQMTKHRVIVSYKYIFSFKVIFISLYRIEYGFTYNRNQKRINAFV